MFDITKFMEAKLNNGSSYIGDDCGCIKGNVAYACGIDRGMAFEVTLWAAKHTKAESTAMDIAERILIKGYPERAKLFIQLMHSKYGLFSNFAPKAKPKSNNKILKAYRKRVRGVVVRNWWTGDSVDTCVNRVFTPAAIKYQTLLSSPLKKVAQASA